MYGNGGYDLDNTAFSNDIRQVEIDRDLFFRTKINASNGLDNFSDLQHQACGKDNLGHSNDIELGKTIEEREGKQCYAFNISNTNFYAITWSDIADAIEDDDFLYDLKEAQIPNPFHIWVKLKLKIYPFTKIV